MKRFILLLSATTLCSVAQAQSFYLKFGSGYSFPLAADPLGKNHSDVYLRETNPETGYYDPSVQIAEEEVSGSHNAGVTSAITVGYVFPSNIGLEVSMGYVFGRTYTVTSTSKEFLDEEIRYAGETTRSWKAANAFIAPSLSLTAGEGMLKPYLTAGPVFAFASIDEKYRHQSDFDPDPVPTVRNEKYSGGVSLGLRGTAGLDLRLSETWHLFSELAFIGMSYYPKEKETVKYELDGEDILSTWTVSARKVKYVKRINSDTRSENAPSDQPAKALRENFGMSSVSAMMGLKIFL